MFSFNKLTKMLILTGALFSAKSTNCSAMVDQVQNDAANRLQNWVQAQDPEVIQGNTIALDNWFQQIGMQAIREENFLQLDGFVIASGYARRVRANNTVNIDCIIACKNNFLQLLNRARDLGAPENAVQALATIYVGIYILPVLLQNIEDLANRDEVAITLHDSSIEFLNHFPIFNELLANMPYMNFLNYPLDQQFEAMNINDDMDIE